MDSRINNLEGHVVLCGAGRNGIEALENLLAHGQEVVVIEMDGDIANELNDQGLYYIEGDATEEEVLLSAGIEKASALVTALPKDTDNVFVVTPEIGLELPLSTLYEGVEFGPEVSEAEEAAAQYEESP